MRRLERAMEVARYAKRTGLPTKEAMELVHAAREQRRLTRRTFLSQAGLAVAGGALASVLPWRRAMAAPPSTDLDVGIVGAGLAGLACADTLQTKGTIATLYEARDRVGGRQFSMGAGPFEGPVTFPGQVVERGGELIDNLHKVLLGYAQQLGLEREDVEKAWGPGETFWFFDGAPVPEEVIVDELRDLVDVMRHDLTQLSSEVTAASHTDFDESLDLMTIAEYLDTRGAAANIRAAFDVSYEIEYGLEIDRQSALSLLFFFHTDKRSRFMPFGVFSDERYHIIGGNQQIAAGLAARFRGPIELGMRLVRVAKRSDGRIELTFKRGSSTLVRVHDAAVLTLPFSTLRDVELDPGLGIPDDKVLAIQTYGYGTNAKLHVGFKARFWRVLGSSGATYSDLPNHQTTWEPNPTRATATDAVLLDYSGGSRGAGLRPNKVQQEAEAWLTDLDKVLPGALAAAKGGRGSRLAHLEHWPTDPFSKGSYTCNRPGYFTTIAGIEGTPVGNLYFAGEHTNSFYDWQGFMEGAALSGIAAADRILRDAR